MNNKEPGVIQTDAPGIFLLPTIDPFIFIEEEYEGYVRYRNVETGRRWEVFGKCAWDDPNAWGPCGEGSVDAPIGPPEGRLDNPVSPEMKCALCIDHGFLRVQKLDGDA